MSIIEISHLTKDYGNKKGIFNVSFHVDKGEVVGFLGPNGAGKTTTIRHLLGFIRSQSGTVTILGKDCFQCVEDIHPQLGYLPGEIAFMDDMTGVEFIHFMAQMKNVKDTSRIQELIDFFELNPRGKIKKMSKGMKQKIALVLAFMQDSAIYILDEPTSGLDPLMQNKFVQLIQKEKERGKTILMSSHIFEEVENTCDRVIMIKDGKIIANETMEHLKSQRHKHYEITFQTEAEASRFIENYNAKREHCHVEFISNDDINHLISILQDYHLIDMNIKAQSLEELFLHYYGGDQV